MDLLSVEKLSKQYRKKNKQNGFALRDISFQIPAGYICGYVGRNGAGKTTTLNAIMHLIRMDSGKIRINGVSFEEDPVRYRQQIGYVGDSSYFPKNFTLKDIREILADFYPSFEPDQFDSLVSRWELPGSQKIKNYSRGMKVKLMFASVLSRSTRILILDEATNGLDPMMRNELLSMLQEYVEDGSRSILFSTHNMEDLQGIADYIFLIEEGRKVFFEPKDELLEEYLLIKGGSDDLTPDFSGQLIGLQKNEFGFSALYPVSETVIPPAGVLSEKPTVDEIIMYMLRQMRKTV